MHLDLVRVEHGLRSVCSGLGGPDEIDKCDNATPYLPDQRRVSNNFLGFRVWTYSQCCCSLHAPVEVARWAAGAPTAPGPHPRVARPSDCSASRRGSLGLGGGGRTQQRSRGGAPARAGALVVAARHPTPLGPYKLTASVFPRLGPQFEECRGVLYDRNHKTREKKSSCVTSRMTIPSSVLFKDTRR